MQSTLTVLAIVASLGVAPAVVLTAPAPATGPMLVILPPWRDAGAVLATAGARPLGPQNAPFAVIATGPPGAAARLRESGAWAVTDASALAAICGVSVET